MRAGSEAWQTVLLVIICLLPAMELTAIDHTAGPDLGQPVTAQQIKDAGVSIYPDGTGLPSGSGNAEQGQQVYTQHCLSCHGSGGEGGSAEPLVGGVGSLASANPEKTVGSYWPYATTLFAVNRYTMPMQSPGILSDDEAYAVTAYLLYLNGMVKFQQSLDERSLPCVKMPALPAFEAAEQVPHYQPGEPGCR